MGAPRIHGELLKLGIDVGQTSVAKYPNIWCGGGFLPRRDVPSYHADGIAAMDLFVVPTISFRLLQIEILWLICGEHSGKTDRTPLERGLRPGALFLVGDPKQAIYRFRGADVNAYIGARTVIGQNSLLKITASFRSVEPILAFVNRRFENVLSEAAGQPGFSELSPIHEAIRGSCPVAALDVAVVGDKPNAASVRDAEAGCVADLCSKLVGNLKVRDHATNDLRPCRYGDIALLVPVGTDLWRFEEALEDRGIPVSTQAGKGARDLYRRCERGT